MAILDDLAASTKRSPLRHFRMPARASGLLATKSPHAAHGPFRQPVQVAPYSGELAIRVAVGAIADVLPGQPHHEGAELQEPCGRRLSSWMICKVRRTTQSPSSRRLGLRVKTLLYSVQTGEAQIMSKWPGANVSSGSQERMSAQMVGLAFGSRSSEVTSHPSSAKARPIDPVPENSSSKRHIGVFHVRLQSQPHQRYERRAPAGQLEVAQNELSPAETLPVLIKKPSVRPPQVCGRLEHAWSDELFYCSP